MQLKTLSRRVAATLAAALASAGLVVATAPASQAATCSVAYNDTWVSGTDRATFTTFQAPYYSGGKLYWKVFGAVKYSGPTARYDFAGPQAKRVGTNAWQSLPYGNFKFLGNIRNGNSPKVNFRVQVIDHQTNSWWWTSRTC